MLDDGTGSIVLKWFRFVRQYLRTLCRKGNLLLVTGDVRRFGDALEMVHPDVFLVEDEHDVGERQGVLPIYPEIEGLKQGTLRRIIKEAFDECGGMDTEFYSRNVEKEQTLPTLNEAFTHLHFPDESILTESVTGAVPEAAHP